MWTERLQCHAHGSEMDVAKPVSGPPVAIADVKSAKVAARRQNRCRDRAAVTHRVIHVDGDVRDSVASPRSNTTDR